MPEQIRYRVNSFCDHFISDKYSIVSLTAKQPLYRRVSSYSQWSDNSSKLKIIENVRLISSALIIKHHIGPI